MRESWSAPGDPAALAAEFAHWNPEARRLLEQVDVAFKWGLYDRDPLTRWTNSRLALLGDAAHHPMLPHMGQGANQAIEDAMALATLLRSLPPPMCRKPWFYTKRYGATALHESNNSRGRMESVSMQGRRTPDPPVGTGLRRRSRRPRLLS
jgi:2-polyprenyl-6-methoxyphenol hydroxylase-like FAD-dependent oxidoreductase